MSDTATYRCQFCGADIPSVQWHDCPAGPLASTDPTPPDAKIRERLLEIGRRFQAREWTHQYCEGQFSRLYSDAVTLQAEVSRLRAENEAMRAQLALEKGIDESLRAETAESQQTIEALRGMVRDAEEASARVALETAALRQDRDRLEFLLEDWAACHVNEETGEKAYHLEWESGWCKSAREVIDAARLAGERHE